jgi:hypothetical protein
MRIWSKAAAIGLASALSLAFMSPSSAAPVSGGAGLRQAVPDNTTDVRWRGGWRGPGFGLGLLGGAIVGGAFGPRYYGYGPYGYYGPYPRYAYYPGPYYGGPYWGPRRYYGWRRYGGRHYRHW